jgi:NAD(P)-dependent dehydrogenase (short-subunit alcohol dehydrogenase family)
VVSRIRAVQNALASDACWTPGPGELTRASPRLRVLALDVTSEDSVATAVREVEAARGTGRGLDGIVNNAGVGVPGPLEALPLDTLRRQLEVNVIGHRPDHQRLLDARGSSARMNERTSAKNDRSSSPSTASKA